MKNVFSRVDLSELPAPDVVEVVGYEQILNGMLADLRQRSPELDGLLPSDPAYKILEVCAYREMLVRQRINEAARATMVAYAQGPDLDNLAANYGVKRLLVSRGDMAAIPPVPDTYEADDALRARVVLSLEAYTTAGSRGSYAFHALSASGEVKDVAISSLQPGTVNVAILGRKANGSADEELIQTVVNALNDETVRPLCDTVVVTSAAVIDYRIEATLDIERGAGQETVLAAAQAAARELAGELHELGRDINRSAILAALHQPGVAKVVLNQPAQDLPVGWNQAAHCTAISLTRRGGDA